MEALQSIVASPFVLVPALFLLLILSVVLLAVYCPRAEENQRLRKIILAQHARIVELSEKSTAAQIDHERTVEAIKGEYIADIGELTSELAFCAARTRGAERKPGGSDRAGGGKAERMIGDFAQSTFTFKADLPQEVIDKVLANTKEDMDKWLEAGNTFDLSDGADRTVAYISFPKGTKPEDVVRVVRCAECKNWLECLIRTDDDGETYSRCCLNGVAVGESFYCADGERKTK